MISPSGNTSRKALRAPPRAFPRKREFPGNAWSSAGHRDRVMVRNFQNFVSPTFQIFWHLPHPKISPPLLKIWYPQHLPYPNFLAPRSEFIQLLAHIQNFCPSLKICYLQHLPHPKFRALVQNLLSSTSPISKNFAPWLRIYYLQLLAHIQKYWPLAQNLLSSTTRPYPKILPPCSEFIIFNYSPTSKNFAPLLRIYYLQLDRKSVV